MHGADTTRDDSIPRPQPSPYAIWKRELMERRQQSWSPGSTSSTSESELSDLAEDSDCKRDLVNDEVVREIMNTFAIELIPVGQTVVTYAETKIASACPEESIFILDLGTVHRRCQAWRELFPRITPFYNVSTNSSPAVVTLLAAWGVSFSCQRRAELDLVRRIGVAMDERVLLSNPCKHPVLLAHASSLGARMLIVDSEPELEKVAKAVPNAKLLIRLRDGRKTSKFGASIEEVYKLLARAKDLGLAVVGVRLATEGGILSRFPHAIELGRKAFDLGLEMGHSMHILDIGDGFPTCRAGDPSSLSTSLGAVAGILNPSLEIFVTAFEHDIAIVAELDTYFVEAAGSIAACIYGKRSVHQPCEATSTLFYWITEGLPVIRSGDRKVQTELDAFPLVRSVEILEDTKVCAVYGRADLGRAVLSQRGPWMNLDIGDWIFFLNRGAQSETAESEPLLTHCDVWSL
eukprot:NODE_537_length_2128_cov_21.763829_g495_i0.p1 GENE.NODE_537_length_2128_cov_21.763829_g495_i0~~NODE_537_length_2128_cov_21.763829_g495_i0.p1  ORF type:complete len:498 (+),score=88.17 NODE_537_length_2128_cov_21.763829_g495_i0:109-1494(+)